LIININDDLKVKEIYNQNINIDSNLSQSDEKVSINEFSSLRCSSWTSSEKKRPPKFKSNNINFDVIEKKIILLADDNHIISNSNKRIIMQVCKEKELDYEIICCSDGMDILINIMDEKTYGQVCLIITDENMEILNGSEAIKIIRTIEERKNISRKFII